MRGLNDSFWRVVAESNRGRYGVTGEAVVKHTKAKGV